MAMLSRFNLLKYGGADLKPYKLDKILDWLKKTKCRCARKLKKEFKLTNKQAEMIMSRWTIDLQVEEEYREMEKKRRKGTILE